MKTPALYAGTIFHTRHAAPRHHFSQPLLLCLLELGDIPSLARQLRLFGHNRFNLFAFYERDHGLRDGSDLRGWVRSRLAAEGIADPGGAVHLLAQPRVLGYVFNPLSVYFCHDRRGVLRAVIYEVHNTFGQAHAYAASIGDGRPERHSAAKELGVSPFLPAAGAYAFSLWPPGESVHLQISFEGRNGSPLLTASLHGVRRPFSDRHLFAESLKRPLSTFRSSAAIYRQGTAIWLKSRLCGRQD